MTKHIKQILIALLILQSGFLCGQENNTFLLKPTGKYSVGTTEYVLTDSSRKETLKLFNRGYRELYVKVWYPSNNTNKNCYSKYLNKYDTKTIYDIFKAKNVTKDYIDYVKTFNTFSCPNVTVSSNEPSFPVLLFNAGYYFGMADLCSSYMEDLASHGYIVVYVSHPYQQPLIVLSEGKEAKLLKKKAQLAFLEWTLKDRFKLKNITGPEVVEVETKKILNKLTRFNGAVDLWVADNQYVIEQLSEINANSSDILYSKLNLNKIGAFGQSVGGAATGQLCYIDNRIKAGVNLDCFQFGDIADKDLQTPFMLIASEYKEKWNIGNEYIFSKTKTDFHSMLFLNTQHLINSDAPLYPDLSDEQKLSFYGNVDGEKTVFVFRKYLLEFFNFYLKDIESDILFKNVSNSEIKYKFR